MLTTLIITNISTECPTRGLGSSTIEDRKKVVLEYGKNYPVSTGLPGGLKWIVV